MKYVENFKIWRNIRYIIIGIAHEYSSQFGTYSSIMNNIKSTSRVDIHGRFYDTSLNVSAEHLKYFVFCLMFQS